MSTWLLEKIASDEIIEQAYTWLCKARCNSHHNDDIWHLRFYWQTLKGQIQQQLLNGEYYFSPCKAYKVNDEYVGVWSAQDALVLKAMSLVLSENLTPELSEHCYHLKGNGGTKGCVMQVKNAVEDYRFVCRSDVNSYYATIDHQILLKQLSLLIFDQKVMSLITRMLNRLDDVNGELLSVKVGINKGNPLSPFLGAVYLKVMDDFIGEYCRERGLRYYRYMDDWLILCRTRNQLRTVVRLMNRILEDVKQTKHPYKTYIGRIRDEGFDFLGYRIGDKKVNGLGIAWNTWDIHFGKVRQLYERGASKECVAGYVKRWLVWVRSGVEICVEDVVEQVLGSEMACVFEGLFGVYL
ncbi:reverse transcriptase/maturase family protein [Crocosphaera sp.]|uniref:reverse transcriptase/maturase family protein n=1 Tax=Crocosphaera sp. TaxID=2729996 RepID=UPI00257AA386|nr:reverse transcriptase/maturase family protein [Crocosphaera sp.]NQZ63566.1 hypothetical protein [Crocosphaera sp.]